MAPAARSKRDVDDMIAATTIKAQRRIILRQNQELARLREKDGRWANLHDRDVAHLGYVLGLLADTRAALASALGFLGRFLGVYEAGDKLRQQDRDRMKEVAGMELPVVPGEEWEEMEE